MKGDFSRSSYDPRKHYRSVLMQQGRVQMDADWNEQLRIDQHVEHATTLDVAGPSGAPLDGGGFRIDAKADGSDLTISAGRMFVDGMLCENDAPIAFADQFAADYPSNTGVAAALGSATIGIVYLDVWERHITTLEDPEIREVALGGPDTCTRAKTVWQVKVLPLPGVSLSASNLLSSLLSQRTGTAAALLAAELTTDTTTILKLRTALAVLDAQIADVTAASGVQCAMSAAPWTSLTAPSGGKLTARVHPGQTPSTPCEVLPLSGYQRLENQLYRVEVHDPGAMGTATFKWSRENGAVVTSWLSQDNLNLKVANTGRDATLGFASGQWVELTDDTHDLLGIPGMMVQIDHIVGDIIIVKQPASGTIKYSDYPRNPKIRRWDQPDAVEKVQVAASNNGYIPLEGGVEILFAGTQFKTGDYWLIPARTAIADTEIGGIDWPQDSGGNPLALGPDGITHHYTRLALVTLQGSQLAVFSDCRRRFAPLTALTECFYLGGDGQSAQPGAMLPEPLRAGVSIGEVPIPGARVRFRCLAGNGSLNGVTGAAVDAITDVNGVATCNWAIDSTTQIQLVEAQLLGPDGNGKHLPIRYTARLEVQKPTLWINDLLMNDNFPLRNGSQITPAELNAGIRIICNAPVMGASLSRSLSCFVTFLIPYPMPSENIWDFGNGSLGYSSVIVKGTATILPYSPNTIVWMPEGTALQWIPVFFSRSASMGITAVPAVLSIKGSFILPAQPPYTPLDADGFIDPTTGLLHLPTGDGKAGGDLELYFWFVQTRSNYYTYSPSGPFGNVQFSGIGTELI